MKNWRQECLDALRQRDDLRAELFNIVEWVGLQTLTPQNRQRINRAKKLLDRIDADVA